MNQIAITPRTLTHQQVYSKSDIFSDQSLWRFCIGVFLMVLSGVIYTWIHVQVVEVGYDINRLEKMKSQLISENKALRTELALLKSPDRLEKIAMEQLGLQLPNEKQFIYISKHPGLKLAEAW